MLLRIFLRCAPVFASLVWVSTAPAVLITDWGGSSYIETAGVFAGQNSTSPQGGFSGGDPLSLNPLAADGYNTSATSALFYGAVTWTDDGSDGGYGRVVNDGNDRIEIKRYNTDLNALVLWRQTDFLNGLNTGNVAFDATSTATMNINTFVGFDPGRVVIRLEGGINDPYYISQETPFDGTGIQFADLTSLTWLSYDPATSLSTFGSQVNLVSGGMISGVTEVGFYTHSNAASPNAFRLDSFEVTAIPEPATVGMLAIGGALLLGLRRREAK